MKKKWLAPIMLATMVSAASPTFAAEITTNNGEAPTSPVIQQPAQISQAPMTFRSLALVQGQILPISVPDSNYISSTSKIDISGLSEYSYHNSISDGSQTVQFSSQLLKNKVPSSWATWSSPPASETNNPDILYSENPSLTINLTNPAKTFGFELEPNSFSTINFTADFYSGSTLLGSINKNVNGNAGAQLFAGTSQNTPIDKVVITGYDTFSIGQIRYSLAPSDKTAPVTNANVSFSPTGFKVTLSATDDKSGVAKTEYSLNGGAWTVYSSSITLQAGQQLQYKSTDKAGNVENPKTLGTVDGGFALENAYLATPFGTIGPINTTLKSSQDLVNLILGIPNK